jgi:hypothetical protein
MYMYLSARFQLCGVQSVRINTGNYRDSAILLELFR